MPASPPLPVVVNARGGAAASAGEALEGRLRDAFARTGHPITLELVEGDGIRAALARHAGAPRVVVGGGDGTLASAAHEFVGVGSELAILPLGTRNHFARQLDVPLDLAAAAALASAGRAYAVDVGEVGGAIFLNNASLGAYVELVRKRDASGLPKLLGSLLAGADVLLHLRGRRYDLVLDGAPQQVETVQLLVGNNRYEVDEGHPGERRSLQDGLLSVFATAPITRLGLLRTAWRLVCGKSDTILDFAIDADVNELRVEGSGRIGIALDGEDTKLQLPLALRSRPGALKVVAPGCCTRTTRLSLRTQATTSRGL